jgi:osmoprotectant transport system substrate-binding protein
MSRLFLALFLIISALYMSPLNACVGKTLHIGILDNPNEQMLAELTSQLITARTGTTVKIETFKAQKELYSAVKQGQVGMVIENTDRALEMIGKPRESGKAGFESAKTEYRKSLNLIWLEPYGTIQWMGNQQLVAPVISNDLLSSLPALPKLLQKLSGIANDSGYSRMLKTRSDEKSKRLAKDFLKSRKLI